jgi:hypothetical protein
LFLASSVLAIWGLGRALRQKRPGAWLFAGLVATYPTVYYFVFPHARYRHPIEPQLFILAVFLFCEIRSGTSLRLGENEALSNASSGKINDLVG